MTSVAALLGRPGRAAGRWRRNPLLVTSSALLALAVVFAAWAGWSWLSAPRTTSAATVRDQALREGEQAVLNFNTLSYRTVKQGVTLWEQSSTGTLHTDIAAGRSTFEQQIEQAKSTTTARILDGALTELNTSAGTASIIVALQITVTPAHGAAATKQSRQEGVITLTPSGWKLSSLEQVPVGAATATGSAG
jgi:Mce-associated membrane protein